MKSKAVSAQIPGKTTIAISPTETTSDLNGTLWGINWFDMKWPLLHRLYMYMTLRHVKKHKAALHFKGTLMEKLEGELKLDRDSLLIVRYPNANAFLKLVSDTFFSLKSILATTAVRKFSFGFTRRIHGPLYQPVIEDIAMDNYYLVHVFQTDNRQLQLLKQDVQHFISDDVNLFFAGIKTAQIGKSRDDGTVTKAPFFIDGIILWESKHIRSLWKFSQEQWYQAFKLQHKFNGLYLFKREN